MKGQDFISKATVDRLPLYFRGLRTLQQEGIDIISSDELGRRIGITPEQIRKDLSSFGEFGKKGVGYYVAELVGNIEEILGLHHHWNLAIIGMGHLGWALAHYQNFKSLGFNLLATFDIAPTKVGKDIDGVKVDALDALERVVKERNIHIGIITVPAQHAQDVANRLVHAGVKGIWNFAPIRIYVPSEVCLINEDLSVGLSSISYYLSRQN